MVKAVHDTYATIALGDLGNVDFSQVGETSSATIRKNLSTPPTEFVLKWNTEPTFITDGTIVPIATYTHAQCLTLMATSTWSLPDPLER
tara:strand:- start:389 stop:655 length:267 start_codon:yes stop_codon:yes gene_type:complete